MSNYCKIVLSFALIPVGVCGMQPSMVRHAVNVAAAALKNPVSHNNIGVAGFEYNDGTVLENTGIQGDTERAKTSKPVVKDSEVNLSGFRDFTVVESATPKPSTSENKAQDDVAARQIVWETQGGISSTTPTPAEYAVELKAVEKESKEELAQLVKNMQEAAKVKDESVVPGVETPTVATPAQAPTLEEPKVETVSSSVFAEQEKAQTTLAACVARMKEARNSVKAFDNNMADALRVRLNRTQESGKSLVAKLRTGAQVSKTWVFARLNRTQEVVTSTENTQASPAVEPVAAQTPATEETVKAADASTSGTATGTSSESGNTSDSNNGANNTGSTSFFEQGRAFLTSHKKSAATALALGVAGVSKLVYDYVNAETVVPVEAPKVAPLSRVAKIKAALPKVTMPAITKKNIAIATVATAAIAAIGYQLFSMYNKPSFDDLVQQYIAETQETDPSVIIEQFCQALEKYGYTSQEDKQKAMQVFVAAGLVEA